MNFNTLTFNLQNLIKKTQFFFIKDAYLFKYDIFIIIIALMHSHTNNFQIIDFEKI